MFDENKNIRLLDLQDRLNLMSSIILIIKKILLDVARSKYAWRRALSTVILHVGLSGPIQALPEKTQSGDMDSSVNLNFSATTPITFPKIMVAGRSDINDLHTGTQEYGLSPEVANTSVMGPEPGNGLPSDTRLARESGKVQLSHGESGSVGLGSPKTVTLAAVTPSVADTNAASARNGEAALEGQKGNMHSRGDGEMFPYATITLAVLALLGLVSVARR